MSKIKIYEDINKMVELCERSLPEGERENAILMLNELSALRNAQETQAARTNLAFAKGMAMENGKPVKRIGIYDPKTTNEDVVITEIFNGNIKAKGFITVRQESVAGKYFLGDYKAVSKKVEKEEDAE